MKGTGRWFGMARQIPLGILVAVFPPCLVALADRPVVDAHIHYSHDAWDNIPPSRALEILQTAGVRRAFVSSSSDQGTQKLYQLDPDRIVPVLRPYRRRGELGSWMYDETVPPMLEALLDKNYYAGIGEFHAFGDDIELPVLKKVIELASRHHLFLHAHSDSSAVENIFDYDENAIVLWAHSGFENSAEIDRMLSQYPNLWADLAFRYEHESGGRVRPEWRELFLKHPDRFMLGTDTYTPERWFYVIEHATNARRWLDDLPPGVAENIAWKNAEALLQATR
jgi:hypothetical protein